jgi:hypothetical protein
VVRRLLDFRNLRVYRRDAFALFHGRKEHLPHSGALFTFLADYLFDDATIPLLRHRTSIIVLFIMSSTSSKRPASPQSSDRPSGAKKTKESSES